MHVSGLATYPVKSCHAVAATKFVVAPTGLPYDRHFVITDADGGFVTQRNVTAMVSLRPSVSTAGLTLQAHGEVLALPWPGPEVAPVPVTVWNDQTMGMDMGDAAAAFLAKHLGSLRGKALRLRCVAPGIWRQAAGGEGHASAPFAFADSMPFLITSENSLADLNRRLLAKGETALPMNRFRPNIVLSEVVPFAEHDFKGLRIGEQVELRMTKACTRCRITMTDQETGALGSEPLNTLGEYRRDARGKIIFGHYAVLVRGEGATIQVGDPVEALS